MKKKFAVVMYLGTSTRYIGIETSETIKTCLDRYKIIFESNNYNECEKYLEEYENIMLL